MRAEALSRQAEDHPCILVVEDEVLVRLEIADALRRAGFRVAEAGNADEAILLLNALDIQLVCTDVRMPGSIDGVALTAFIKTNCPGVPVVIISGESTAKYTPDLADAKFTKPVDSTRLIRKIQGLLARPAGDVNV